MGNQTSQLERPDLPDKDAQDSSSHDRDSDQDEETTTGASAGAGGGHGELGSDSYDVNPSSSDIAIFSSQAPQSADIPTKKNWNNSANNNTNPTNPDTLHTYHTHPFLSQVPRNRSRSRISYPNNPNDPGNTGNTGNPDNSGNSGNLGNSAKSRKSRKSNKPSKSSSKRANLGGPSGDSGSAVGGAELIKPNHHQYDAMTGATIAIDANDATNYNNPDASFLNAQPPPPSSPSPSSPSLKFEPAEPAVSQSPSPTPSRSDTEFTSAATRQILSEAKSDPYVTFSSLQLHDDDDDDGHDDNDNVQDDAEQTLQDHSDMGSNPSTTAKLSKREKKARKRRQKKQKARQERDLNADGTLDEEAAAGTVATVATPKSSKKRKRKSSRHDVDPEVPIPQTQIEDSSDFIDPTPTVAPPASKKRKSKHHEKEVRETREATPDETQNSQHHDEPDEPDEDVVMDEAAASSAGVSESDEIPFGSIVESLYDDHVNKQTGNRPNTASPEPDSEPESNNEPDPNIEESQSDAERSSAQEEEDATEHHFVKSDILGEDPAGEMSATKNSPASADDESSEPDSTSGAESRDKAPSVEDAGQRSDDLGTSGDIASADASSNSADDDSDQVEVPSSVPIQNDRLSFAGSARRPEAKSDNTLPKVKKRVMVLGNTSSRVASSQVNGSTIQEIASPAAAAASRRKGREAVAESSTKATKTPTTEGKQRRITSMMGDGSSTPAAPSSARIQTPGKTPGKSSRYITGPFTPFELQSIDQAVERWREDHELTEYEVNELVQSDPREVNSTDFWNTIHATCPDRLRQKVINICRRRHHNFIARGTWTAEQSEELTRMFDQFGNKYTKIAKLINRHPEDVRDRYRNFVVCGENRRTSTWSQEEEQQLIDIVHQALDHIKQWQSRARGRKRNIPPEELIDWQTVSQNMNRTRSRQQCMQKWKVIRAQQEDNGIDGVQFSSIEELIEKGRAEAESMTHEDRLELVKAVDAIGVTAESRIPWVQLRKRALGSRWTRMALMVAWHRLSRLFDDKTWQTSMIPLLTKALLTRYDETNRLDYPDSNDAQLRSEFLKIKHTIERRFRSIGGSNMEGDTIIDDESDDDVDMEDAARDQDQDERGSVDLGDGGNTVKSSAEKASADKDEIQDSDPEPEPPKKVKKTPKSKTPKSKTPKSKGPKPRSTNEAFSNYEVQDSEPEAVPSKKAKGTADSKTPKSHSNNSSKKKRKSGVTEGTTPAAATATAPASSAKEMLARGKSRKTKKRLEAPALSGDSDNAQSSDTNASDVESIPAH